MTCRLVGMTTRENWLGSTTPTWKLTMAPWALLAGEELLAGGLCTIIILILCSYIMFHELANNIYIEKLV